MKKIVSVMLAFALMALTGCSRPGHSNAEDRENFYDMPPRILLDGLSYYDTELCIVNTLPKGYVYAGKLSEKEKEEAGFEGVDYYVKEGETPPRDIYVYMECGTPVSENEVDTTQRQWAYVKWSLPKEKKDILPLKVFGETKGIEIPPADVKTKAVNFPIRSLSETVDEKYEGQKEWEKIANFLLEEEGLVLDENWLVTIHFFDDARTAGMVKLVETVGKVRTDKAVVLSVENGMATQMMHSNLQKNLDREKISKTVLLFEERYRQEPYIPKPGEILEEETTTYTYSYEVDRLFYCYNVFFRDEMGFIHNEYGTEVLIKEDGEAMWE